MKLAIVTSYFNPCGFKRPINNLVRYVDGLGGASERLTLVSMSCDGTEPDWSALLPANHDLINIITVAGRRPAHMLWQKERMLSHAIRLLPAEYDAVAWIDGDVLFQDSGWLEQAELMLEKNPVIQLFRKCVQLGPNDRIERVRTALAEMRGDGSAWGFAWAARREIVADGLLDWAITGAGDALMADAWMGVRRQSRLMSAEMSGLYRPWAEEQRKLTGGFVNYLHGTIEHLWHGTMESRRYHHRNRLLVKHRFNPAVDIIADNPMLYRWADPESQLAREVIEWFEQRAEDG